MIMNAKKLIIDHGDKYELEYIDPTHFKSFILDSKGIKQYPSNPTILHVDQMKGDPPYEEICEWLEFERLFKAAYSSGEFFTRYDFPNEASVMFDNDLCEWVIDGESRYTLSDEELLREIKDMTIANNLIIASIKRKTNG